MTQNAEELNKHNAFARYNGVVVQEAADDRCVVYADITENSLNPYDTVHGGLFFTVADNCAGGASRTDGKLWVTQNASVSYLRAVRSGRITGVGQVVHRGRKTCVVDVSIYDSGCTLVFKGTFSYYCIE